MTRLGHAGCGKQRRAQVSGGKLEVLVLLVELGSGEGTDDHRIPSTLIWMNFPVYKELSRTLSHCATPCLAGSGRNDQCSSCSGLDIWGQKLWH